MARSFLTPINLNKLELQNARIQNLATAPSSPVVGQIYYDTALNGLYIYNGTAWALAGGISAGALASRPLANAVAAGTFFYATDNFLIYYSNGSAWQQVDNFGSGQSTALTISGTGADGTSTNFARADHTHAGPGFGAVTAATSYGLGSSNGSATTVAHSDHTHGTPSLTSVTPSTITAASAAVGTGTAPAREDHVHAFTPSNFTLDTFGAPAADVSLNNHKITNLATPTAGTDAANKAYVDATASSLNVHGSVSVATTTTLAATYSAGTSGADGGTGVGATITFSSTGTTVVDSYTLASGDRILVKNGITADAGTSSKANGIYLVTTAGTSGVATVLTRATDYDNHVAGQVVAGDFTFVGSGGQANTGWVQSNLGSSSTPHDGIKIGTDAITFTQFSGAGTYLAGNGLALTGNTFSFNPTSTGGLAAASGGASILLPSASGLTTTSSGLALNPTTSGGLTTNSFGALILLNSTSGLATTTGGLAVTPGLGITISGQGAAGAATTNQVAINTDVVVRKYATSIGDGASLSYTVTHNLATKDVQVTLYDNSTNVEYFADVTHSTTNTVTVAFSTAPTTNQIRVVVFG